MHAKDVCKVFFNYEAIFNNVHVLTKGNLLLVVDI